MGGKRIPPPPETREMISGKMVEAPVEARPAGAQAMAKGAEGEAPIKAVYVIDLDRYTSKALDLIDMIELLGYTLSHSRMIDLIKDWKEIKRFMKMDGEARKLYVIRIIKKRMAPGVYLVTKKAGGVWYRLEGVCSIVEAKRLIEALTIFVTTAKSTAELKMVVRNNLKFLRKWAKAGVVTDEYHFIYLNKYPIDSTLLRKAIEEVGYPVGEEISWGELMDLKEYEEFEKMEKEGKGIEYIEKLIREKEEPGIYIIERRGEGGVYYKLYGVCSGEEAKRLIEALYDLYQVVKIKNYKRGVDYIRREFVKLASLMAFSIEKKAKGLLHF